MQDPERYPAPVRAVGSNHSTTACGMADDGTLIVTRKMDKILEFGDRHGDRRRRARSTSTSTTSLRKRGLQFYVNVELGNLTIGSACCGGTKDASMPGEFGQIASYAVGIKMVLPNGELFEVDESEPELLQVCRSSYGLFGIVYEVTFRVRQLRRDGGAPREVHASTSSPRGCRSCGPRNESMMLYINPFRDTITVEFRRVPRRATPSTGERRGSGGCATTSGATWRRCPATTSSRQVPWKRLSSALDRLLQRADRPRADPRHQGQRRPLPQAQQIRYPARRRTTPGTPSASGRSRRSATSTACAPTSRSSKEHYRRTGYRINLLSVGYRILADQSSLFSYSYNGTVITFDPVSTGTRGWETFLREYNALCSGLGGVPLFNQTNLLTRSQVDTGVRGPARPSSGATGSASTPTDRLLNAYFRELLAATPAERRSTVTPDDVKAVARSYFDELTNKQNVDFADQLFTATSRSTTRAIVPDGQAHGHPRGQAVLRGVLQGLPGLHFAINDFFAEGDKVAIRFTWTGTHRRSSSGSSSRSAASRAGHRHLPHRRTGGSPRSGSRSTVATCSSSSAASGTRSEAAEPT